MRAALLLLCSILTGCISAEEVARRQALAAQEQEARDRAYTQALASQCLAIGYQAGTDAFRGCILTLHGQNQQEAAQMRGIAVQEALRRQYQQLPPCSSLDPFNAGFRRSQGTCR